MTPRPDTLGAFWTSSVTEHLDRKFSRVAQPLVYATRIPNGHGRKLVVPVGFVTDFASIPRALWALLPRDGSYQPAAVLHDWLYSETDVSREDADDIFLEAMEACGTWGPVRRFIWLGVRLFGWIFHE